MRLLLHNEAGDFRLKDFGGGREVPPYAILSHTWGPDEDEVTFKDMINGSGKDKLGYEKIRFCEKQAREHGLQYFWIDTCCIDKSSSAELTESINSMFRWYQSAEICFVYLSDLKPGDKAAILAQLPRCKWFTRGWTLQELIAPRWIHFLDQQWHYCGSKDELQDELSEIAKIDKSVLTNTSSPEFLNQFSIAHRMSWASGRKTTRSEDEAYCLLGIFSVSLPLIYGEGSMAFRRLQEEIVKRNNDLTIFAWSPSGKTEYCSILAPSPAVFSGSRDVEKFPPALFDPEFSINNRGLRITASLWMIPVEQPRSTTSKYFLRLGGSRDIPVGVFLIKVGVSFYFRDGRRPLGTTFKDKTWPAGLRSTEIYISTDPPIVTKPIDLTRFSRISFALPFNKHWYPSTIMQEESWDFEKGLFFGGNNHTIQVLKVIVHIPGTSRNVSIVALCQTLDSPTTCLIFNARDEDHEMLAKYLFQPRNVNERFRMSDLRWNYPDVNHLTHSIVVAVDVEVYCIEARMYSGITESISKTTPIHSLTFETTKQLEKK